MSKPSTKPAPDISFVDLVKLIDELRSEISNRGEHTEIGKLFERSSDALYEIAVACLDGRMQG